ALCSLPAVVLAERAGYRRLRMSGPRVVTHGVSWSDRSRRQPAAQSPQAHGRRALTNLAKGLAAWLSRVPLGRRPICCARPTGLRRVSEAGSRPWPAPGEALRLLSLRLDLAADSATRPRSFPVRRLP